MIDQTTIPVLTDAKVVDAAGDSLGSVKQVYVSDDGGQPLFVTVHTGLFGTKETFVPLQSADLVDGTLRLAYDKATIKDAPNVDADGQISDDEQGTIFDYYDGRAGGAPSGVDGTPAGLAGTTDPALTSTVDDAPTGTMSDDAMTRSEERLQVGTERVETDRVRLRKHVVTEQQTVTVPVTHDEIRLEREPIAEGDAAATAGLELTDAEHEVVLTAERPVVEKTTVPVERVRLSKDSVTEDQTVSADVRSERIDIDGDDETAR
jgi:uncharacterized protein (TIGR02271 family)